MSVERPTPQVVAFDGLHRSGKGTQATLLHEANIASGVKSIIVRGDGTRDGLGLTEGDPYCPEWQKRSREMKSGNSNSVEDWNASSLLLMTELQNHIRENEKDMIIVDRSILSRAAFLLHRGVFDTSDEVSIHDLYPGNSSLDSDIRVDFKKTLPNILFNLSPKNPKVLLDRLDKDDPKYQFRSRNIKGGFNAAQSAVDLLPKSLQEIVVDIDCSEDERVIRNRVVRSLGRVGLGSWLKMIDD